MEWNDAAIVLHVGRFREADLWLRLLSRHKGLVTVFAFGGSRSRRRFCGCLDILNTISCRVKTGRRGGEYLTLEEGTLLRGPQKLRSQWANFGMIMNCVRFLDALPMAYDACTNDCASAPSQTSSITSLATSTQNSDCNDTLTNAAPAPAAFALMQDMLSLMEGAQQDSLTEHHRSGIALAPHPLHPVLFRLRMACELGFAPAWHQCAVCGALFEHQNVLFKMDEGTCLCTHCAPRTHSPYALPMTASALHFLRTVQNAPPTTWDAHALSSKDKQTCFRAVDGFTQFHLGIAWDAGRFKRV